jgi:Protein of unknown function (DUF3306)
MSESFLSRWSRRKRDASIPPPQGEGGEDRRSEPGGGNTSHTQLSKAPPTPDPSPPRATRAGGGEPQDPSSAQETEFDAATLPPIESIDAGADVSAFLRPGVPAELTQAALHRAWTTDPAIRDFVGLAENAWDFNKPGGVPGFEPLRAIDDVQRLLAHVAGVLPAAESQTTAADETKEIAAASQATAQPAPASVPPEETATSGGDAAAQKDVGDTTDRNPARPRHGGALAE